MREYTKVMVHMKDDTTVTAYSSGRACWLEVGSVLTIFVSNENQLGELAGAIDQASKLLNFDI